MRSGINDMELTRVHIHHEVDTSIRKLGLKHINLYQIHGLDLLTTIGGLRTRIQPRRCKAAGC